MKGGGGEGREEGEERKGKEERSGGEGVGEY